MGTLISILLFIICILLILVVMVQNPKGGGLASEFSSANQIGGVRRTADFLEKTTWTLAISLVVLSLVSAGFSKRTNPQGMRDESVVSDELIQEQQFGGNRGGGQNVVAPDPSQIQKKQEKGQNKEKGGGNDN